MMKNNLGALNNYLFESLERLNDAENFEELEVEIRRSHAVSAIAKNIINNGELALRVREAMVDRLDEDEEVPKMLEAD